MHVKRFLGGRQPRDNVFAKLRLALLPTSPSQVAVGDHLVGVADGHDDALVVVVTIVLLEHDIHHLVVYHWH